MPIIITIIEKELTSKGTQKWLAVIVKPEKGPRPRNGDGHFRFRRNNAIQVWRFFEGEILLYPRQYF